MKKAYVFLAPGFETIEATTPIDVLRRCGVEVKTVAVPAAPEFAKNHTEEESLFVECAHGVTMKADLLLKDIADEPLTDIVILPGGYPGYVNLASNALVGAIVKKYYMAGKYIAAICAAPIVLAQNAIATGCKVTCHTCAIEIMTAQDRTSSDGTSKHKPLYQYTGHNVEVDDQIITGIGAGHSLEFALTIARLLTDSKVVEDVCRQLELR